MHTSCMQCMYKYDRNVSVYYGRARLMFTIYGSSVFNLLGTRSMCTLPCPTAAGEFLIDLIANANARQTKKPAAAGFLTSSKPHQTKKPAAAGFLKNLSSSLID